MWPRRPDAPLWKQHGTPPPDFRHFHPPSAPIFHGPTILSLLAISNCIPLVPLPARAFLLNWLETKPSMGPMNNNGSSQQEAEARFQRLLNQRAPAFRLRVNTRADILIEAISGSTGECNDDFNSVLSDNSFELELAPGALPVLRSSPADAKETAAILCKIGLRKGLIKGQEDEGPQRLGWKSLNADAKGWCKNLLLADLPETADSNDLRQLLIAKSFVAILVDYLPPCEEREIVIVDPPDMKDVDG